mgnify:CR=1 FL=1
MSRVEQLKLLEAMDWDSPEIMEVPRVSEIVKMLPKIREAIPRTIALFHSIKGIAETVAIDFDVGERGRIGRLSPSGLYVRNIAGRDEEERIRFVQRYLEKGLGEGLAREVIDSAINEIPMQTQYKNPVEEGYVVTNIPSILPLGRIVTYKLGK